MIFADNIVENLVRLAQEEAAHAAATGDAPFGAVLTDAQGNVVARAHNTQRSDGDPTAHGEINLLRAAAKNSGRLTFEGYHLFINAEPCSMCLSACIKAGIRHYYYGAPHEAHMEPNLSAEQIAMTCREKVYLYPDILKESCVQQIAEARKNLPPID